MNFMVNSTKIKMLYQFKKLENRGEQGVLNFGSYILDNKNIKIV